MGSSMKSALIHTFSFIPLTDIKTHSGECVNKLEAWQRGWLHQTVNLARKKRGGSNPSASTIFEDDTVTCTTMSSRTSKSSMLVRLVGALRHQPVSEYHVEYNREALTHCTRSRNHHNVKLLVHIFRGMGLLGVDTCFASRIQNGSNPWFSTKFRMRSANTKFNF